MKYKYHILLAIFLISFTSSLILANQPAPLFCGEETSCNIVTNSKYAYTFGIKNSEYGIFIFAFLSLLTFLHIKDPHEIKKATIHTGTIIGAIIATYFLYLQQFVIGAYCKYCLIVDFGLIIGMIIVLFKWKR
jgi:uncharacterized membrane protein